jgi:SOS-response transcriptional repressor LexA
MHIGTRIQRLMKAKKITTKAMSAHCGVTPSAVSSWFSTGRISKEKLALAAELLEVRIEELISGDSADVSDLIEIPPPGAPAALSVPLLSWVRAGDFCESPGQFCMEDAEEFLPRPLFNTSKKTFALLVRGDSMDVSGGYREGEIVYIDPDVSPTPGRDVLAKTESGMTLKRYKEDEDGPYLLQLNGNKIIRPANWHVCGVVVFSGQKR